MSPIDVLLVMNFGYKKGKIVTIFLRHSFIKFVTFFICCEHFSPSETVDSAIQKFASAFTICIVVFASPINFLVTVDQKARSDVELGNQSSEALDQRVGTVRRRNLPDRSNYKNQNSK